MNKIAYSNQKSYCEENPVVSFRLPQGEKKALEILAAREGMTLGEYLRDFLNGVFINLDQVLRKYEKVFEKKYRVWYFCNVCGEPIYIKPGGEAHKAIMQYMSKRGWGHRACHTKPKEQE